MQEETISDCKQGATETGGKESTIDLRGRVEEEPNSESLSPPHPPHGFLPAESYSGHDADSRVLNGTRGRTA